MDRVGVRCGIQPRIISTSQSAQDCNHSGTTVETKAEASNYVLIALGMMANAVVTTSLDIM